MLLRTPVVHNCLSARQPYPCIGHHDVSDLDALQTAAKLTASLSSQENCGRRPGASGPEKRLLLAQVLIVALKAA